MREHGNSLSHVGSSPLHSAALSPTRLQTRVASPSSLKPEPHRYIAILPGIVSVTVTMPFGGSFRTGHSSTAMYVCLNMHLSISERAFLKTANNPHIHIWAPLHSINQCLNRF